MRSAGFQCCPDMRCGSCCGHASRQTYGYQQYQLWLQAPGAKQLLQSQGGAAQAQHGALVGLLAIEQIEHRHPITLNEVEALAQQDIQQYTTAQCNKAHQQRDIETMPQRQAAIGSPFAEHRLHAIVQQRADDKTRDDADNQAEHYQYFHREAHPAWWFMRRLRQVRGRFAKEDVNETQRIDHAEDAHGHGSQWHPPIAVATDQQGFGKEHFLGQETV